MLFGGNVPFAERARRPVRRFIVALTCGRISKSNRLMLVGFSTGGTDAVRRR